MSDTVAVALITGALTIVASAGTAWVTLRHQRVVAEDDRKEQRRRDARQVIIAMLPAARSFYRTWLIWAPALGMARSKDEALRFLTDTLELDTGKVFSEQSDILLRALTEADLTVSDDELRTAVRDLRLLVEGLGTEIIAKILDAVDKRADTIPLIGQSLAYLDEMKAAADRVEKRAGELMRSEL